MNQNATTPKSLIRSYDPDFKVDDHYRNQLPDVQNEGTNSIEGSAVPLIQVGIHNFRLPLNFPTENRGNISLEVSVTGTVSLSADRKGINMSRIMRIFYKFKDHPFNLEILEEILRTYLKEIKGDRANLRLKFSYPILKPSLRSNLEGFQYYDVVYEGKIDPSGTFRKIIHFDFVYSSSCPCSCDLAEHAREERSIYAVPHSQRSKARISVEVKPQETLLLEKLQSTCLEALQTETQVMVRREDEQAFAELNGAYVKFVEDAARLLCQSLEKLDTVCDYQIVCSHLESLHSHDAVAVLHKGVPNGFTGEFHHFESLLC